MNRTLALLSALGVGLSTVVFTGSAMAQAAAPAPAAPAAPVKPEAIPAKIALINFEAAVSQTNEGKMALQAIDAKYAPDETKIKTEAADVDALKKQAQGTMADAERAKLLADIDAKEKQLNLDVETAQNTSGADVQEALGKVAQKLSTTVIKYVKDNGFTILLDVGAQGSNILWAMQETDITQAVIDGYNATSGVAAPLPAAPAATGAPRPRANPPTAPRTAAPKPPAK